MKPRSIAFVWAVLLGALFLFASPLAEALWVLYSLIHWGIAAAGVAILIAAIVGGVRRKPGAAVPILICLIGLSLFFTEGFRWGRVGLFTLRTSHYEELLAEARRSGSVGSGVGVQDEGPPVRYAFYWQRGILDNWSGVVYDPSGELMKVNDSTNHGLHLLFGGTLYKCERLRGHWYLCWFT